jgi:hypothetical protein
MVDSIIIHLVFGITVGMISSLLLLRFGSRYGYAIHDIPFSRIDSYQKHIELVHWTKPIQQKRILLILGGGFPTVEILRRLQKASTTAQRAIREGKVVAKNLISRIKNNREKKKQEERGMRGCHDASFQLILTRVYRRRRRRRRRKRRR